MKIQEDRLCSACGEQEETSLHFLGEYYANMQITYSIFKQAQLVQPSELHKVKHLLFYGSQEPQRGSLNLWLQWGCTLGLTS